MKKETKNNEELIRYCVRLGKLLMLKDMNLITEEQFSIIKNKLKKV